MNDPTLLSPTARRTSVTERSVWRSSAAARSSRRVKRYLCGVSPKARRNSRLKCAGERWAARASAGTSSGSRYREPLDVPALARAAHLSPAHFSREFRRAFGETPHKYLLTRRLERAAALLRHTDRSVTDVRLAVGLSSVGSFITSFGRTFGLSPSAYRAANAPASAHVR